jgi:large subunit ribosomal protein L17
MHRHAYHGRKLSRKAGPRRALLRNLVTSLLLHERIETTLAKAKEVAPEVERVITIAKKGGLTARRKLTAELQTENAALKLIHELAPALGQRTSGHTSIIKAGFRRGDNAPMAVVSLLLPAKLETTSASDEKPTKTAAKTPPKAATKAKPVKTKEASNA